MRYFMALAILWAGFFPVPSHAEAEISVQNAWARVTLADRPAAVFLDIINHGRADRLIEAHAALAGAVELHTHTMQNGIMQMRRVDAIDIPAQTTTRLKPHGDHIMLFNLPRIPQSGETFPLTLIFSHTGAITVSITVR